MQRLERAKYFEKQGDIRCENLKTVCRWIDTGVWSPEAPKIMLTKQASVDNTAKGVIKLSDMVKANEKLIQESENKAEKGQGGTVSSPIQDAGVGNRRKTAVDQVR